MKLALALLIGIFASAPALAQRLVDRVVAVINTEIVLESDFKKLQSQLRNPSLMDESLLLGETFENLKSSRSLQLDYLVREKILDSEIKRLNLAVTSERVKQEIRDMAKRNNVTEDEIFSSVAAQGISKSSYQDFIKTKIERQQLIESEIISKLRINDEDALAEYMRRNPNKKTTVNEFSVAHIFFNPKKGGADEAYKRAERALTALRAGADSFETLAEQFSEDPNFATGGFLGNFKSGEFLSEIEDSIHDLKPDQTTPIIRSRLGFHIVKLLGKKISTDSNFEKQKSQIISELMESHYKRQLKIWLQTKHDEAFVRINSTEK